MSIIITEILSDTFNFDQLAPSTKAEISQAQRVAKILDAPEVFPEHLFLGIIAHADADVAKVLESLGLDMRVIRSQAAEAFGILSKMGSDENELPLSREALVCFEWAFAFVSETHAPLIFPKHLLLSVLRHPRIQSVLILLLPMRDALPAPLVENVGPNYTRYMDQLIHSRVRDQSVIDFDKNVPRRILRRVERPTITFIDIRGMETAKQQLRGVIDFLRRPQIFQESSKSYLYGRLLFGHPSTNRTLLVEATAGEAVVPLISLSISMLIDMLTAIDSGVVRIEELDLERDDYDILKNSEASQRGRNMLRHIFEQARKASPCILFLDNLDAIEGLASNQERERYWRQLVIEMDGPDYHPPMVVLATTSRTENIDRALLRPGRFERQIVVSNSFMAQPAAQTKLCLSCNNEGLANWKHCVYCGALLAQVCPHCGTPSTQLEGAQFCYECGNSLGGSLYVRRDN